MLYSAKTELSTKERTKDKPHDPRKEIAVDIILSAAKDLERQQPKPVWCKTKTKQQKDQWERRRTNATNFFFSRAKGYRFWRNHWFEQAGYDEGARDKAIEYLRGKV